MPRTRLVSQITSRKTEYLALAGTVLLGAVLRFYRLESIPVGLSGDEGADGLGAKRILRGEELPIFITEDFGEEPLHTYMVALSFAVWGASLWAIRFVSASVGIVTIPVLYWLARELVPQEGRNWRLVPILSALFLATSYWHIIYSRAGLEVVTLPLFSSALLLCLLMAIRTRKRWLFVASGLVLGVSLYSYRGARFLPILLVLFFGIWALVSREFRRQQLTNLVLAALVAALVCAPLGAYALMHPDIFFAREMHVSIFNPSWERGSPAQAFAYALAKTMGMFNFQGDPEFDRNPGRRPVLDPVSSLCFIIGLAVVLWRWRQPRRLFIVVWFLVMALPGAFTAEALPHFHRGIGALPPLCLLCAFGATWVTERLAAAPWRGARASSGAVLCLMLLTPTILSYRDYFLPWQQRLNQGQVIGSSLIEAAEVMNVTRIPEGVWILPASSLRPRNLPYYEVSFLYDGPEPEYTLTVDEETGPRDLSAITQGRQRAAVINWKEYDIREAYLSLNSDPKGLLDFLLRKYGRRLDEEPHGSFDLVTYELPDDADFAIAKSIEPAHLEFATQLRLEGVALGGSSLQATSTSDEVQRNIVPSGKDGWVVLQWRALSQPAADYKVAVYLLDSRGRVVGQVDKLLLSDYLEGTSRWGAGQLEMDYYSLPCEPATPPGKYTVQVAVYNADTLERLSVFDAQTGASRTAVPVGEFEVVRPITPAKVQPREQLSSPEIDIAPGVQLLGYDMPSRVVSPGETARVALYWRATEELSQDYLLSLELEDESGKALIVQQGRPVDGTYPTTQWGQGELLRDWHDMPVPGDTPSGGYELWLRVLEDDHLTAQVSLGFVEVQGRPRQFEIPEIQHPLEAMVGDAVRLLGYDFASQQVKPGDTLSLVLYWQALDEMQVSYTVFTHLLDADERIWGQMDSIPLGGKAPTTSWLPGEVVADQYELLVDPEATPGGYSVEVGLYDASTGERLPVFVDDHRQDADRLMLPGLRIGP